MLMGSMWWMGWVVWLGAGFFGLSPDTPIPSISPYSDVDLPATLRFTHRLAKAHFVGPAQSLVITSYTDRPRLWTPLRYKAAMAMARWYLGRCRIRLPEAPLHILPAGTLTHKGLVRWRLKDLRKTKDPHETMLFFTESVVYLWGRPPRRYRLLGVSSKVLMRAAGQKAWSVRPGVWTRLSPVYSTLAHEIGHRLGLEHSRKPYHLMLDGPAVRSSFATLWTSALGYFAPRRFLFSPRQCTTMHKKLRAERQPKGPKHRILRIKPLERMVPLGRHTSTPRTTRPPPVSRR